RNKKKGKGKIEGVRCEHIPQELIRNTFPTAARQFADLKNFFKIAITLDDRGILGLKVRLGEFRFKQDGTEFHVDFGSFDETAGQRNTGLESELRQIANPRSQDRTELFSFRYSGIAEYIH